MSSFIETTKSEYGPSQVNLPGNQNARDGAGATPNAEVQNKIYGAPEPGTFPVRAIVTGPEGPQIDGVITGRMNAKFGDMARQGYVESSWPTNTVLPQRTLFPGDPGDACVEWGSESRFNYPEQATDIEEDTDGEGGWGSKGPKRKKPEEEDQGADFIWKEVWREEEEKSVSNPDDASEVIHYKRIKKILFQDYISGEYAILEFTNDAQGIVV